MCPFYKEEIFKAIQPYCKLTISGQGIDIYLIPCLQKILGLEKTAVVHAIQIKHCRPVQSGNKIYSNGINNPARAITGLINKNFADIVTTLYSTPIIIIIITVLNYYNKHIIF
jgi:hypothetical protein